MIFSRLSSKLLSQPYDHEDPNLELIQAPEGERGYASRSSGAIRHVEASLHCLFNNEDLAFDGGLYYMQSIGQEIELSDCSATLGEHGEGTGDGSSAVITPLCACEQSLYWAQQAGYACAEEELIYFYHPDYLGSVEFITDMRGEPYQFFLNTPWGENLENQFAKNYTSFSSRFRFNGKEWDEETGNYYYGARYFDPKVSVWLSVDPWASKYPHATPYNFVENNPIMLIDPDGNGPWQPCGDGTWVAQAGDGAETLAQDAGISIERAYEVMDQQGHGTYVDTKDGVTKSAVDPGDVVTVPEQKQAFNQRVERNQKLSEEIKANQRSISTLDKKVDSLHKLGDILKNELEMSKAIKENMPDFPDEPRGGLGFGVSIRNSLKELKIRKLNEQAGDLIKTSDSLRNVNKGKNKIK